jgi:hypothetical protein
MVFHCTLIFNGKATPRWGKEQIKAFSRICMGNEYHGFKKSGKRFGYVPSMEDNLIL